jgi:alpha-amylase/alpha-mannosidase (GH57 family)
MRTALVVHGHFYQPPRENPWTGLVEREAGARPFHDWNERIHAECYRPNAFARIVDSFGRVERIVNNYANVSFNFGPTLLSWLEREHPATYARVREADRESVARHGGHGNAIAQGYNHVIIPLCNERDRRTQVRWGVADFRQRFGREPESLWLPETACDERTLDLLVEEGMRYVILSPYQAARVRKDGDDSWQDVSDGSIDTSIPYKHLHTDGSGRSLAVFFYDGPIARAIAFEGALASSQGLVDRFARSATGEARLVNVATDGETYGHHFKFGDRCLAYALEVEAPAQGFWVTNYGEFLDHYPPTHEVELARGLSGEGTAWSCAHGLGRWSRDCGCQTGAQEGWNQAWRAPLRAALDLLRDEAALRFEETRGQLFKDPWAARDEYIELLLASQRPAEHRAAQEAFLDRHAVHRLSSDEQTRALTFLELQRHAMVMYTSCGWFFADLAGIETLQVMRYAGRVVELMEELGLESRREEFLAVLSEAQSNLPLLGNGADIYRRFVEASRVSPQRVAAHLSISGLVDQNREAGEAAGFSYRLEEFQKQQHGRLTLSTCHLVLDSIATRQRQDYAVAAMYFGDVDFYCVLRDFPGEREFRAATEYLWTSFRAGSLPAILRVAQELFGPDEYGLEHLLPDGRQSISASLFRRMVDRFSEQYELLYEDNRRNIEMLQEAGFELPKELRSAAEFTIGRRFEKELRRQQENYDPAAYMKALGLAEEAARHGYRIKRSAIWRLVEEMIARTVSYSVANPSSENIQLALMLIRMTKKLGFDANLDEAQEAVYEALRKGLPVSDEMHVLALTLGLSSGLLQQRALPLPEELPASAEAAPEAEALPS